MSGGSLDAHLGAYQEFLDKIDKVRRLTQGEKDIKTPTVVACGDQSMGKSSVLETISGVNLPRGEGTKTRVPLEMQLRRAKTKDQECIRISAQLDSDCKLENNQLIDESQISDKIEEFTNALAGKDKNIVDKPITLTIYRCNLVNLTLIDLPGIVRNCKDEKLPQTITKMIERYMKNEETIILNVVSCMVDADTSESVKMSKTHDPQCERSLVVFTFVDRNELDSSIVTKYQLCQMDLDFDARHIFFVRNRTKTENENNVSLAQVQENEKKFFEDKKVAYDGIPEECLGSQQLTRTLVKLQKHKILQILPNIKENLTKRIKELSYEIENTRRAIETPDEAKEELFDIIGMLFESLVHSREGTIRIDDNFTNNSKNKPKICINQRFICAETLNIFEMFKDRVRLIRKPKDFIDDKFILKLRKLDRNSRGFPALPGTTHPSIAVQIVGEMVHKVSGPAMDMVDDVCDCVKRYIFEYINEYSRNFPVLHRSLQDIMGSMLDKCKQECVKDIENLIRREKKPFSLNQGFECKVNEIERILLLNKSQEEQKLSGNILVPSQPSYSFQTPLEIEVSCTENNSDSVDKTSVAGVYRLQRGFGNNGSVTPTYYKFCNSKLYTIEKNTAIKNKWVITEATDSVDSCDGGSTASSTVQTNSSNSGSGPKVIATQTSNENATNPIFVRSWDLGGLSINSLDLVPLLNSHDYNRMDNITRKMFDQAIKISCYWKVVCDRICDIFPMCVRDYLVDKPCDQRARSRVQIEVTKIKNDKIKTDDEWLMYLLGLDEKKLNRRKYCEQKLVNLRAAKREVQDVEFISQSLEDESDTYNAD